MNNIETLLKENGIAPTPVRLLVFRCLYENRRPLSLSDMESLLETVDKSSISRTLTLLRNKQLIHSFNDGSGSVKYELSGYSNEESENGTHIHFRCEKCGETYCMPMVRVPEVTLPEGYIKKEINYVITGICAGCSS